MGEPAYQQTPAYAEMRLQGRPTDGSVLGAVAIIQHPDVRSMLAHMRATTEACRALSAFSAGWQDTPDVAMAEFLVPVVKGFCTEMSVRTASLGVQSHGGIGFIEETGAARHYRDARIFRFTKARPPFKPMTFWAAKPCAMAGPLRGALLR